MLYGRLPTSRMPAGRRAKSNSSASAQCTVSRYGGKRAASAAARSRSTSIASSLPARSSSGAVSAPSPGPISTRKSLGAGAMASTMRPRTRGSCRKCWPNRLRGRCELDGKLERLREARAVCAARAGEVERGAVVDRGADEGQAERDVHAAAEARVLQHRQPLVVIHGEHRIGLPQALGDEQRVGRNGSLRVDAGAHGRGNRRRDHLHVLTSEMARFAAVRIEPGDENARPRDAEATPEIRIKDAQRADEPSGGDGARHVREGEVRGGERDAQTAADQHHTTRAAPERSARYSVWPVKAMPASLSTLFCTGAVTMAAYSPSMQPRIARSRTAST